jgi:carbon starvation protein CstA
MTFRSDTFLSTGIGNNVVRKLPVFVSTLRVKDMMYLYAFFLVVEVMNIITSLDDGFRIFEMVQVVLTVFPVKL